MNKQAFITFFTSQMDYIFFFYGFSFIVLALICISLTYRKEESVLRWKYLALFGLIHGINEWLDMLAVDLGDTPLFSSIRVVIMALSFLSLFEFGRGKLPKIVYLVLIPLSLLGLFSGMSGLNVTVRYVLGFGGALLASITLIIYSIRSTKIYFSLLIAGILMFLYGISSGLIVPKNTILLSMYINHPWFLNFASFPVQLLRGLLAFGLASSVWIFYREKYGKNKAFFGNWLIVIVLAVLSIGWFFTYRIGIVRDIEERGDLSAINEAAAAGLNYRRLGSPTWSATDITNPDYIRLREMLMLMGKTSKSARWFYVVGLKDGVTYFLIDSVESSSEDHSEPGDVYNNSPKELLEVFNTGKSTSTPIYTDEWGSFISSFVPILDPSTGKVLVVMGADKDADDFQTSILQARASPIAVTLLILVILIISFLALQSLNEAKMSLIEASENLVKFKLAVDNTSNHVVITDTEGLVLYANPAVTKITGYEISEVLGTKAGTLWGRMMTKEFYAGMWHTIKVDQKPLSTNITNKRKNGEKYEALVNISPVFDSAGVLKYFIGIEIDVTKEREIDRMKTEFISLASHQLRTPLSAIKWYLEMLLAGDAGQLNKEQLEFVKNVDLSNDRMIELVNSLLNVSRIESGRIIIDPKPTDVAALLTDVVSELSQRMKQKKIQVIPSFNKNIPQINIDAKLIRQVFLNLLTNSIKYTQEGGEISLFVSKDSKDLVVQVSDNGYGIPEEAKAKVFEKFYRAPNIVKRETDGNGLGLYLVKAIVESSGGKIWFESAENKGTTFWVSIPLTGSLAKEGTVSIDS